MENEDLMAEVTSRKASSVTRRPTQLPSVHTGERTPTGAGKVGAKKEEIKTCNLKQPCHQRKKCDDG